MFCKGSPEITIKFIDNKSRTKLEIAIYLKRNAEKRVSDNR
jgi:hypothetical protein